jgi:predicted O-methyltransferase YrrM
LADRARAPIALLRQAFYLVLLPRRARAFYLRALGRALRTRDRSSLCGVTRPRELVPLLRIARRSSRIVEVGTGTAWTSICLALSNPRARVASYDIEPIPYREPYIGMLDEQTRERIDWLTRDGSDPVDEGPVDLVYIDASHERSDTLRTFLAWQDRVARGGGVAFHDYADSAWPGVTQAVRELGLDGEVHGHLFIWTKPDPS